MAGTKMNKLRGGTPTTTHPAYPVYINPVGVWMLPGLDRLSWLLGLWLVVPCIASLHSFQAVALFIHLGGFMRPAWVATDFHYHGKAWLHGHIAIKEDTHLGFVSVSVYLCMNVSSVRGICNPYYVVFCPHLPISAFIYQIGTLIACHEINDMR